MIFVAKLSIRDDKVKYSKDSLAFLRTADIKTITFNRPLIPVPSLLLVIVLHFIQCSFNNAAIKFDNLKSQLRHQPFTV